MMRSVIAIAFFVLSVASSAVSGNVTGKINFKGTAPTVAKIKMNADPRCVKLHGGKEVSSDQVTVNPNNTLRWTFVYVKKGLEGRKFDVPKTPAKLDQKGCMYEPHVFGIVTSQPIEIVNSDPTLHNVHALSKNSPQFNIAQPKQGMKMTKTFTKPEVMIKVKCEVHSWMASYIGVLDHPFFAVSDEKGNFEIKGLPAGDYELEAWHEKYGTQSMKVSVGAADTKTADFTFEGE
jgi:plastocyanin